MHDLFFQRWSALKSEEVKAPHQMRPKGHHYREGICAHTERGDKINCSEPRSCHPALTIFQPPAIAPCVTSKMPREGCLDLMCPQSSQNLKLAAQISACVLSSLPAWRACSHLQTTSRIHPTRMCCALPQAANRALNPQLASSTGHAAIPEGSFALCHVWRTFADWGLSICTLGAVWGSSATLYLSLSWVSSPADPSGQDTTPFVFAKQLAEGHPRQP